MKRVVWVSYELNNIFSSFKYDENFSLVVNNIKCFSLKKKIVNFHDQLKKLICRFQTSVVYHKI